MLVLTRRKGQLIVVGKDILIEVMKVEGGRAVIGIKAPRQVKILRGEVNGDQYGDQSKRSDERSESERSDERGKTRRDDEPGPKAAPGDSAGGDP